jgi:hypothetical protein
MNDIMGIIYVICQALEKKISRHFLIFFIQFLLQKNLSKSWEMMVGIIWLRMPSIYIRNLKLTLQIRMLVTLKVNVVINWITL